MIYLKKCACQDVLICIRAVLVRSVVLDITMNNFKSGQHFG
jgi:hypothetical protein